MGLQGLDVKIEHDLRPENMAYDSKVHGANRGPIWGRHDPGWPHGGPINFAIWGMIE